MPPIMARNQPLSEWSASFGFIMAVPLALDANMASTDASTSTSGTSHAAMSARDR